MLEKKMIFRIEINFLKNNKIIKGNKTKIETEIINN